MRGSDDIVILACDLASKTGFALGRPGSAPRSWTKSFGRPDDEPDMAIRRMARYFHGLLRFLPISLVLYEEPLSGAVIARLGNTHARSGDVMHRYVGCLIAMAALRGIRTAHVSPITHRKVFTGSGRHADPKRATIKQVRLMGWGSPTMDHNEADAVSVWHYGCVTFAPKLAAQTGPLFVT